MPQGKIRPITEAQLYAGFNRVTRPLLKYWKDHIVEIGDSTTLSTADRINHELLSKNVVIFFDHHYAFDALPVALVLGQLLKHVTRALIPYAVHLDMGVNQVGLPSLRYRLRTLAFKWLIDNIQMANSNIHIMPVVREFELNQPRLKAIADSQFSGANTSYLRIFTQSFSHHKKGLVSILSPMAGLALPEKPALHPQIFRLMKMVQARQKQSLPFFFVSAYPKLQTHYHYLAPLLTKHTFVARGPLEFPTGSYEQARVIVANHIRQLRQAAQFTSPDYTRIEHK
jgi:hypothetical protein